MERIEGYLAQLEVMLSADDSRAAAAFGELTERLAEMERAVAAIRRKVVGY